ncbi:hypothetical protein KL864_33185 [Mycolicibacterium goodii]|uniref:hypothetical protein n=1 Tax=Mycolicibacterium goodii TaxID=134601 RepID=UPI001BDC40C5|nr:hypothetical protein [Mycolicibacterium goodii]MBU8820725.1 hypothetical protein [Mycolicibacterium goodii]
MSALYLVKDGDRAVILAAECDGCLYGYIPNVAAFVYNKPMSVDFLIDREMTYQPVDHDEAAAIIKAGQIGLIDGRTNKFLLDHAKAETRRLDPSEILGANRLHEPAPTVEQSSSTPTGQRRSHRTRGSNRRTPEKGGA